MPYENTFCVQINVFMHTKSIVCKIATCHMDYFTDVPMGLGTFQLHCCLCTVRKLSDFIKKILICVMTMNEGFIGFGHKGN